VPLQYHQWQIKGIGYIGIRRARRTNEEWGMEEQREEGLIPRDQKLLTLLDQNLESVPAAVLLERLPL
jgi:hypothetical protein